MPMYYSRVSNALAIYLSLVSSPRNGTQHAIVGRAMSPPTEHLSSVSVSKCGSPWCYLLTPSLPSPDILPVFRPAERDLP